MDKYNTKLVDALTPVLGELLKQEVDSLANHLAIRLKLEKNEVKQSINEYFSSKSEDVQPVLKEKGTGVIITEDFSSVSFAVSGDIEPLKEFFHGLKLLKYNPSLKGIGKGYTGSKSRLQDFVNALDKEEIEYKRIKQTEETERIVKKKK